MSIEDLSKLSYEELLVTASRYQKYYTAVSVGAKKYLANNQNIRLFNSCKANAKRKNIEFSIVLEDIVIPDRCIFLDVPLSNISGEGRVRYNASIDRVDSTKGYTKDNIQIISDLANRMKQNATPQELLSFSRNVQKLYGKKK